MSHEPHPSRPYITSRCFAYHQHEAPATCCAGLEPASSRRLAHSSFDSCTGGGAPELVLLAGTGVMRVVQNPRISATRRIFACTVKPSACIVGFEWSIESCKWSQLSVCVSRSQMILKTAPVLGMRSGACIAWGGARLACFGQVHSCTAVEGPARPDSKQPASTWPQARTVHTQQAMGNRLP